MMKQLSIFDTEEKIPEHYGLKVGGFAVLYGNYEEIFLVTGFLKNTDNKLLVSLKSKLCSMNWLASSRDIKPAEYKPKYKETYDYLLRNTEIKDGKINWVFN